MYRPGCGHPGRCRSSTRSDRQGRGEAILGGSLALVILSACPQPGRLRRMSIADVDVRRCDDKTHWRDRHSRQGARNRLDGNAGSVCCIREVGMDDPQIVPRDAWLAARRQLLGKEKEFTRQPDGLNAERRRLPMTEIDKEYVFEGRGGKPSLPDLFEDRGQLLIYHFMFAPDWEEGCKSCSFLADNIGHLAPLHARDTTLALVSRAPLAKIEPFRQRMGWTVPWYSSFGSDFNYDFHVTLDQAVAPVEYNYRNLAALGPEWQ